LISLYHHRSFAGRPIGGPAMMSAKHGSGKSHGE
jgi:hypothetical protein